MKQKSQRIFSLHEASERAGIDSAVVLFFIQHEWVRPSEPELLDEEDIARVRFILELREQLGVNDEAIPIILHLADQLYFLRDQIGTFSS